MNMVSAMIVADTEAGVRRSQQAAQAACLTIAATVQPDAALDELSARLNIDIVIVDIERDTGAVIDEIAAALDAGAQAGRFRSVVTVPLELVDAFDARMSHRDTAILCAPSQIDAVAALGFATADRSLALHDITRESDQARLLRLSEEVARIARSLAEVSDRGCAAQRRLGEAPFAFSARSSRGAPPCARDIRAMIRVRRLRDSFFDASLFADPGWDMLLDLMAARIEQRQVAVSSLCIAAAVPPTTALRWIKTMTEAGLFARRCDPRDGRRVFIDLSDEATGAMEGWFAAVRQDCEMLPA